MHITIITDKEISGMYITIIAIESYSDISDCRTAEEKREATLEDEHLNTMAELTLHGWPSTKNQGTKITATPLVIQDKIGLSSKEDE